MQKKVLITGGAGFIGSNFVPFFLQQNPTYYVVNLDKLTYAGDLANLKGLEDNARHLFVEGDICDAALVAKIFEEHSIDSVIHFAAESHVDNSIENPDNFIKTNIRGTFVLLEAARRFWLRKTSSNTKNRFHHVSTDEVYGSLGKTGFFTEKTPYAPNSPYSASKAAGDFLVRSYYHTYGLNTVTSNCSNNFGPKQHSEKLIPTIIRKALALEEIPIYGDGSNVRDWLFVSDHCEALNLIFHKGKAGETYAVGAGNECNNLYIAKQICRLLDVEHPKSMGSYSDQIAFVADRPGHDFRYAIDATKIQTELGWTPNQGFEQGLQQTVRWYLTKYLSHKT